MKQIVFIVAVILLTSCNEREPSNFHECITRNIKPGLDEEGNALMLITASCRNQFPEKDRSRSLASSKMMKISGRGGLSHEGTSFTGTFYNGNPNISITEVVIRLVYKQGKERSFRDFRINLKIEPLSAANVSTVVINEPNIDSYGWEIISGRGIQEE